MHAPPLSSFSLVERGEKEKKVSEGLFGLKFSFVLFTFLLSEDLTGEGGPIPTQSEDRVKQSAETWPFILWKLSHTASRCVVASFHLGYNCFVLG